MKREFRYPSRDGVTGIHADEWIPEGEVKAVLQICHGMTEYINRYDEFACFLNGYGIYVTGHDHLGHGESVQGKDDYGYFHVKKGNQYVIGDIHKLRGITMRKYPEVPYFILGHSMGSFLVRQYLTMYGNGLAGAIIMGTGHHGTLELNLGLAICRAAALVKGWKYRSRVINNLSFGGYNRSFKNDPSGATWLSANVENCERYAADPLCSFQFTVNGYYQMFKGMKVLAKKESMERIPKKLPVLFAAGTDDPVGDFGRSVRYVYGKYRSAGMQDVKIRLYKGDRHEILNETDRQQVYSDLYRWMRKRFGDGVK